MNPYEEKLRNYIEQSNIEAEQLIFQESCHSVAEAALALGVPEDEIVKNICLIDVKDNLILVTVKGEDRVSTSRVAKVLNVDGVRVATEEEIRDKTGYLCGGVPSFGFEATYIIDPRVMEKEFVYTGGGSENALLKISTRDLQGASNGMVLRVRR
jgi:prolyl-tRNA editing enzyme YbaK/EbsC (Cys-tRNA(Pro) deacylase)